MGFQLAYRDVTVVMLYRTRCDQKVPRLIFLFGCGYTSGHPCLQGGVLELPLSLGQGMVPAHISVLCELWSKRVVYLRLVIFRAAERMTLVCGNKHGAGSRGSWKLYGGNHHGRWDVGLRVWPGDETSVFAVEVCWFPEAKESVPGAVKSESNAHYFLLYGGHCSLWVRSTRPNCKTTVLSTSFETSETCCFSQEATETGGGGLGATSRQCTSTQHIPCRYFWQVMAFLSFSNHPTSLTWLCVTFGCSPVKNCDEREEIWRHWRN